MSLATSPSTYHSLRATDPTTAQQKAQEQALEALEALEQQWQEALIVAALRKHNEQARRNNRKMKAEAQRCYQVIEG